MNLEELRDLPPTLNARQTAELLGIGLNQTYDRAREGEIPVLRLGRTLRFPTARILEMLGVDPSGGSPSGNEEEPLGESVRHLGRR